MYWLSALIINGILSSLAIWGLGDKVDCRKIALLSCLISIVLFYQISLLINFSDGSIILNESFTWIPFLNISAKLGIDGVSWALIALTLVINLIIISSSFLANYHRMSLYIGLFIWMQSMVIGVFSALDAVLFYMFWEGMLIPMYLCIGVWG